VAVELPLEAGSIPDGQKGADLSEPKNFAGFSVYAAPSHFFPEGAVGG